MIRSTLSSWREYLTPITHKSTFLTTGQITPEEFVQAGDYLCHMFPTWKWNEESSDNSYRDFLPKNKQFLIIRKSSL
ncbi:CPS_collapsed_G0049170.mRNA.1.CDS.1 [Saccharomyces cerevisiae]|nr:CPS_collapsed_G0049170.mRNA.1.CDS.1 [Saccharomyces cerevisiae]